MENNGRRLGWIAIGIGVVALVIALAGRVGPWNRVDTVTQSTSAANVDGSLNAGPTGRFGFDRQGSESESDQASPSMSRGFRSMMAHGQGRFQDRPFHGFFFFPFFVLSKLFHLVLWGLAIYLVIKAFRNRKQAERDHNDPPPTPPATGQTTTL